MNALFVGGSVSGAVFNGAVKIDDSTVDPSDPEVQKKLFPGATIGPSFYGPNAKGGSLVNHGTITIGGTTLEKSGDVSKQQPEQPTETVYIHDDISVTSDGASHSFGDTSGKSYVVTGKITIGP